MFVSTVSLVTEEWGSGTHSHTCGTPLKQDGSVPVSVFVFSLQTPLKFLSRGDGKVSALQLDLSNSRVLH